MIKICFFGMGSIGKRHLKNLVKILKIENDHFLMIFYTFLLNFLSFFENE